MTNELTVNVEVNRPFLPAGRYEDEPLYALLTLHPEGGVVGDQRAPLNIVLVVDASATMFNFQLSPDEREYWVSVALSRNEMERGEADDRDVVYWSGQTLLEMQSSVRKPMTMAVEAIKNLLHGLQFGDRVSVVAFADYAHTVFNDTDWERDPERCYQDLDNLLDQRLPVHIGTGTKMATSLKMGRDILARAISAAAINRIIVLSDGIVQDDENTMDAIEEIQQQGYAITTLGLGDDFDEEFLMRVADNSRGAYYYAADIHQITEQLLEELTVIKSTAVHQLFVSAQGLNECMVQDLFMVRPYMTIFEEIDTTGGWLRARVGDLPADVPTSLLLQVAPGLVNEGDQKVADLQMTWQDGGEERMQTISVSTQFTSDLTLLQRRNDQVQELVDRFNVYRFEREAQRAQERGDIETAREKLGAATRELHKLGEMALAQDLEAQIATLGGADQDPSRIKRIKATTRKLGDKALGKTRTLAPRE